MGRCVRRVVVKGRRGAEREGRGRARFGGGRKLERERRQRELRERKLRLTMAPPAWRMGTVGRKAGMESMAEAEEEERGDVRTSWIHSMTHLKSIRMSRSVSVMQQLTSSEVPSRVDLGDVYEVIDRGRG